MKLLEGDRARPVFCPCTCTVASSAASATAAVNPEHGQLGAVTAVHSQAHCCSGASGLVQVDYRGSSDRGPGPAHYRGQRAIELSIYALVVQPALCSGQDRTLPSACCAARTKLESLTASIGSGWV